MTEDFAAAFPEPTSDGPSNEELEAHLPDYFVGEKVWDDLVRSPQTIVRIERDEHGNMAVYTDSEYLEGGRFPWELSRLIQDK